MTAQARAYLALMAATVGRATVGRLLVLQALIALMEGAGLTLLVPVLQSLGGADDLSVPGTGAQVSLPVAFALVLAVMVLRALAQWRAAVLSVDVRMTTIDTLRLRLLERLFDAEWSYVATQRQSHVVQRLTSEVDRAHNALVTLMKAIVGALVLLATVAVAVLISPLIGLIAVLGLLGVAAASAKSVRTAMRLGEATTDGVTGFGAALSDSLASARLTRAHGASRAWTGLVADEAQRLRGTRTAFVRKTSGIMAALSVAVVAAVLLLVLAGRQAGLPFAELAALVVVASRVLNAAQNLLGSVQVFANDAPSLAALVRFENEIAEHREPPGTPGNNPETGPTTPLVSLQAVSFRYSTDQPTVLDDVSFEVPRRALTTLSGASGSGKSTVLDLVLGLMRPGTGALLVDGEPLTDLVSWRSRVGYVPQQTVLVPGTVWQNLVWSLAPGQTATRDDAWAALRGACLDSVVSAMPGGLDAPLRELAELSGGEQQRLSIARALIRRPELLVLDEATSALDPATEARVLDHLLDGTRTVLMVTHRPSDRARADVTVHLQDGSATVLGR